MNSQAYDRKHAAMTRKLRIVQGTLKSLRADLFGTAENGSTPQARFADQLLEFIPIKPSVAMASAARASYATPSRLP
jgi:hypothetical protein